MPKCERNFKGLDQDYILNQKFKSPEIYELGLFSSCLARIERHRKYSWNTKAKKGGQFV